MLSGNIKNEKDALSSVPSVYQEGIVPSGGTQAALILVQAGSLLCEQSLREGLGLLLSPSNTGPKDLL